MATYNNSVVVKFDTAQNGNAGAGASITVYLAGTDTKADITHSGSSPTDNPMYADGQGNYTFDVNDGIYDIVINEGFLSEEKLHNEQIKTIISFEDATGHYQSLQEAIATDINVGDVITTAGYYSANDGGAGQYVVVAGGTGVDDGGSYLDMVNGNQLELIVVEPVSVKLYGVNKSITDNADRIESVFSSGLCLDWGCHDDEYKTSREVVFDSDHRVDWISAGAKIKLDNVASQQQSVLYLNVEPYDHSIIGSLIIEANNLAYSGLIVRNRTLPLVNFPIGAPSLLFEDITVNNVYRTSQDFIVGDGISIIGGFNRLVLTRPYIDSVKMAVGADIIGVAGVSGITIADDNEDNYPYSVVVEDCYINNIYSEDSSVNYDQDGIKLFTDRGIGTENTQTSFIVRGGTIRNSRNRSIKLQSQSGQISNLKIVKTSEIDLGNNGITQNPDIDFQTGGGFVENIEFYYDNFVGIEMVRYTEDSTNRNIVPSLTLDGLQASFTATTTQRPEAVIKPFSDSTRNQMNVNISNVQVIGEADYIVQARVNGPEKSFINCSNIYGTAKTAFFAVTSSGKARFNAVNCQQIGMDITAWEAASGTDQQISIINGNGFLDAPDIKSASGPFAPASRVHSIAPLDALTTGVMRPFTLELADQEIGQFPPSGVNTGACMIVIRVGVGGTPGGRAIIVDTSSGSSGNVIQLTDSTTGTGFSVNNGTVEPVSPVEDYIMWASATAFEGAYIKNNSGSTKIITCYMIG